MAVQECIYSGGGGTKVLCMTSAEAYALPTTRVECGFKPRIIMAFDSAYNTSHRLSILYNSDDINTGTTKFYQQYDGTGSTQNVDSAQQLYNIDDTGFNLVYKQNYSQAGHGYIVAIE